MRRRAEPAPIELIDVRKSFDGARALRGISFAAPAGAITALQGPAGAGKTVAVRLVLGLDRPDDGAVLVAGTDVSRARERRLRALRRELSVMFQGAVPFGCGLFESATAHENVAFPLRQRNPGRREGLLDGQAQDYLRRVGLADAAGEPASALADGQRKRLALARALALRAPIAVLDDFDGGMEPALVDSVCELVREEQALHPGTYLLTTRDAEVAWRMADHLVVLDQGRLARDPFDAVPQAAGVGG